MAYAKFWLMRMHQIKIFHIFVPNLGEIYQFGNNKKKDLKPALNENVGSEKLFLY